MSDNLAEIVKTRMARRIIRGGNGLIEGSCGREAGRNWRIWG